MKTVRIIALRQDRKRLLEHLQDSALIQVKSVEKPSEGFSKVDVSAQTQLFERNVTLTEQALKILDDHSREKKGLLDSFKGRRKIDPDELGEIASKAGGVINVCARITELDKELSSNAAEQVRINTSLAQLEAWQKLDIPLNTHDTKSTAVCRTPKVKAQRLRDKSERLVKENEAAVAEIISLADKREEIKVTQDYFRIRADKYNVINSLDHSKHVFVIEGYVPEDNCDELEKLCNRVSTCHIEFGEADENAPVLLKNNKLAEPAQGILTMYSPPSADDIDPTPILAFFFYFFFGMMFSDAGYGLLMTVVIGIVLKVFKPDKKMRNNLKLFQYCGISTFLWGLVFGSIFGDAPAALYNYFNGTSLTMKDILPWPTLDPQKDALLLMVVSIAFGLVHILVGMGCKFYICLRKKDWGGAFFDTGLWMLLLIGIAILAVGIFASPTLVTVGAVISIGCAVGLVLTQGRTKKGIVGKAIGGLASLYDVTGYISDLLSYSRLLALGLTTGVMAQVFNMLSTMMGRSVVGFIFMVVIFVVGHAVNIGLNALGSYVHTMRLQYVEMFSKFYEGGGEEFAPFSLNSKYIKIQEDN